MPGLEILIDLARFVQEPLLRSQTIKRNSVVEEANTVDGIFVGTGNSTEDINSELCKKNLACNDLRSAQEQVKHLAEPLNDLNRLDSGHAESDVILFKLRKSQMYDLVEFARGRTSTCLNPEERSGCNVAAIDMESILNIHSGLMSKAYNTKGMWCQMPGPPNAGEFWKKHVEPSGGYFNLGCCGNEMQYGVLGIAAWGKQDFDTCYAAHAHYNEEAYWQFGGSGIWRKWNLTEYRAFGNENPGLPSQKVTLTEVRGKPGYLAEHYSFVPHEMEIPKGEYMLNAYWWAMDYSSDSAATHYQCNASTHCATY